MTNKTNGNEREIDLRRNDDQSRGRVKKVRCDVIRFLQVLADRSCSQVICMRCQYALHISYSYVFMRTHQSASLTLVEISILLSNFFFQARAKGIPNSTITVGYRISVRIGEDLYESLPKERREMLGF